MKIQSDGTGRLRRSAAPGPGSINVIGNWVYYSNLDDQ